MESIISAVVPQLIDELYKQVISHKDASSLADCSVESLVRRPSLLSSFSSPCTSPKPGELYEAMSLARDRAILAVNTAVNTYTGHMLAAIGARHNHLLPIYRLPSEILSMIFKMTERSATNCFHSLETRAPLNLSRVSKLWREIALDTPSLWVAIDVMNIELAPTFLERSRNAALEITMTSGGMYDEEDRSGTYSGEEPERFATELRGVREAYELSACDLHGFLEPLLPHIDRWQSLTLEVPAAGSELDGFLLPSAPALALTTFQCAVDFPDDPSTLPTLHPDLLNERLPSLSSLSLENIALPSELAPTALKGLRRLAIKEVMYEPGEFERAQFFYLLQACPLLESLELRSVDLPSPTEELPLISLQQLRNLTFDHMDSDLIHDLLSRIIAPSSLRVELLSIVYLQLAPIFTPLLYARQPHASFHAIRNWRFKRSVDRLSVFGETADGTEVLQLDLYSQPIADVTACFDHVLSKVPSESLSFDGIVHRRYGSFFLARPLTLYTVTSMSFVRCTTQFLDNLFSNCAFPRLQNLRVENCRIDSTLLTVLVFPAISLLDPSGMGPDGDAQIAHTCRIEYADDIVGDPAAEVLMLRRF
ncbi:hypothetical protein BOTBODRAFT_362551 [Botryobasidium botryosum FD-172 SS1]|uniref:F-box domain-containing protein n=1 Tax=Botryobasidium botryosum (strain FD-172 SS1) TaxID=930990 RepID=A0A067MQL1_BOTB1|nr:hypothetical protein BOTBODRAFT_362551 [Botryobasidium botryosum FD-172 SS1]